MLEEKETKRCQGEAIYWCCIWGIIKLLLRNICHQKMYLHSAGRWSWWSSYVPSTSKLLSTRKSNAVFSGKKTRKKKKKSSLLSNHHTGRWIVLEKRGFIIDSSILQEIFSCASKCLSCMRRKHIRAEMRC